MSTDNKVLSEDKCLCGEPAVDAITLTNKKLTLKIGFCEEHRGEAEIGVQMLMRKCMNEL